MRQKLVVGVVSIAALLGLQPWADVDDQVMQLGEPVTVASLPDAVDEDARAVITTAEEPEMIAITHHVPDGVTYHVGPFVMEALGDATSTTTMSKTSPVQLYAEVIEIEANLEIVLSETVWLVATPGITIGGLLSLRGDRG